LTLQPPQPITKKKRVDIFCRKCGARIIFDKDHVSANGRKIPLDPFFNNQPHAKYCMYATSRSDPGVESILVDFLSRVKSPKQRKIIGAVE
jgi:hypothetical protein